MIDRELLERPAEAIGPSAPAAMVKTLLLIDLVDSTGLLARIGDKRAQEVFASHDQLARALLAQFDGREVDKSDGFLLLFDRPVQAVAYALAYQRNRSPARRAPGLRLAARAGIHLGEVLLRESSPVEVALGAKPLEVDGPGETHGGPGVPPGRGRGRSLSTQARSISPGGQPWAKDRRRQPRWLAHGTYLLQGIDERDRGLRGGDGRLRSAQCARGLAEGPPCGAGRRRGHSRLAARGGAGGALAPSLARGAQARRRRLRRGLAGPPREDGRSSRLQVLLRRRTAALAPARGHAVSHPQGHAGRARRHRTHPRLELQGSAFLPRGGVPGLGPPGLGGGAGRRGGRGARDPAGDRRPGGHCTGSRPLGRRPPQRHQAQQRPDHHRPRRRRQDPSDRLRYRSAHGRGACTRVDHPAGLDGDGRARYHLDRRRYAPLSGAGAAWRARRRRCSRTSTPSACCCTRSWLET